MKIDAENSENLKNEFCIKLNDDMFFDQVIGRKIILSVIEWGFKAGIQGYAGIDVFVGKKEFNGREYPTEIICRTIGPRGRLKECTDYDDVED